MQNGMIRPVDKALFGSPVRSRAKDFLPRSSALNNRMEYAMNKLFMVAALASSALTGSAYANDTGPYITIEGGAVKQERAEVSSALGYDYTDRFSTGWEAGGAVGYDFGHFRLEAEGFHARSSLREQDRAGGALVLNQGNGLAGHTSTTAVMGNALIGLGHWGGIKFYAGGGAGYAHAQLVEYAGSTDEIQGTSNGFAWQGLAGMTIPVSHNLDFGVRYRYFRPQDARNFVAIDGTNREVSLRSHSLLATLTYNFGQHAPEPVAEPAAAPPPPPPPPAPPPPPPPPMAMAPVCNKGPYIVFFDWDKSAISSEAASILDNAITAYGTCGTVPITLAGYTDSSGTPRYNMGLAGRRDDSVQSYLTSHGVAAAAISSHAYGEANQRVPTADGVRELQNRRVEINYGPGSGN